MNYAIVTVHLYNKYSCKYIFYASHSLVKRLGSTLAAKLAIRLYQKYIFIDQENICSYYIDYTNAVKFLHGYNS